jgi:hypothetical protein
LINTDLRAWCSLEPVVAGRAGTRQRVADVLEVFGDRGRTHPKAILQRDDPRRVLAGA